MPVTTVLSEEGSATIIDAGNDNGGTYANRFSWSAAFAGAFLATAVTFFLLALGAGFGLSLVSVHTTTTPTFLTLGAIYFLTAQAFGFAAGGHLAGRLIGPAAETAKEEEFRSAAHGLVVWALAVVATATMIAIGTFTAGSSAATVAASSSKFDGAQTDTLTPSYVGYWTDMLFRPGASPSQASIAWSKYAQADTGTANDASPYPAQQQTPGPDTGGDSATAPSGPPRQITPASPSASAPSTPPVSSGPVDPGLPATPTTGVTSATTPAPSDQQIATTPTNFVAPVSLASDKAETGRIIETGMANGGRLNQYDKDRISALVAQDTGLAAPEAQRRVDNAETRIHNDEIQAADTARKIASHTALWIALSLLFGAVVAAAAAVSARWEDDRVTFSFSRRDPV